MRSAQIRCDRYTGEKITILICRNVNGGSGKIVEKEPLEPSGWKRRYKYRRTMVKDENIQKSLDEKRSVSNIETEGNPNHYWSSLQRK